MITVNYWNVTYGINHYGEEIEAKLEWLKIGVFHVRVLIQEGDQCLLINYFMLDGRVPEPDNYFSILGVALLEFVPVCSSDI